MIYLHELLHNIFSTAYLILAMMNVQNEYIVLFNLNKYNFTLYELRTIQKISDYIKISRLIALPWALLFILKNSIMMMRCWG